VLEIKPTLAQFVKINPRQWRDGENHAALRCALLIAKQDLVVTLAFTDHGVKATNLAGEVILETALSDDITLAAISSSVKAITKHDGPVKLISAGGDLLYGNLDNMPGVRGQQTVDEMSTVWEQIDSIEASAPPAQQRRRRCQYGVECYRKNPEHRQTYAHPGDPDWEQTHDTTVPPPPAIHPAPIVRRARSSRSGA
jgi:hypothetical protein